MANQEKERAVHKLKPFNVINFSTWSTIWASRKEVSKYVYTRIRYLFKVITELVEMSPKKEGNQLIKVSPMVI